MFKNLNIFIVLCLQLCLIYADTQQPAYKDITEIPSSVPVCSASDKNLNECLRRAFQEMLPRAKNGIPELNIPPTDPLVIEKNSYEFTNNIIQGKVGLRNLRINGLSKSTFSSVDYKKDGENLKLLIKAQIPELFVEGKYRAEVKINDAKLNSKGEFNLTMTDIDAKIFAEAELYERNGKKYIRLTTFNIEPTLGNMRFFATGLMPDPILNDAIIDFVNQNWRNVYKSFITESRSTWEPEILKVSNEYLSHISFDLLLT